MGNRKKKGSKKNTSIQALMPTGKEFSAQFYSDMEGPINIIRSEELKNYIIRLENYYQDVSLKAQIAKEEGHTFLESFFSRMVIILNIKNIVYQKKWLVYQFSRLKVFFNMNE